MTENNIHGLRNKTFRLGFSISSRWYFFRAITAVFPAVFPILFSASCPKFFTRKLVKKLWAFSGEQRLEIQQEIDCSYCSEKISTWWDREPMSQFYSIVQETYIPKCECPSSFNGDPYVFCLLYFILVIINNLEKL